MAEYDAQPGRTPPPAPGLSDAQLEADELELDAGLAGVAGIVAGARGLSGTLGDVAEFAVTAIPGVDCAGIVLIQPGSDPIHRHTWAVTADIVEVIDTVQHEEVGEGPCITCMQTRRPTVSGSLGSDPRWPRFGGRVARMGVHSALSLPLLVNDDVIGAINTYAHVRDAFTEHAVKSGGRFVGSAAITVHNASLLEQAHIRTRQLQRALERRAVIDQAIGIIRSRSGEDAEAAFLRLVRISQAENVKVHVVAEQVVDAAVRRARARHH